MSLSNGHTGLSLNTHQIDKIPSGIDTCYEPYQDEVVQCPAGLRLKETPNGRIRMVLNELEPRRISTIKQFKLSI